MPRRIEGLVGRFVVVECDFVKSCLHCISEFLRGNPQFRQSTVDLWIVLELTFRNRLPHLPERCRWLVRIWMHLGGFSAHTTAFLVSFDTNNLDFARGARVKSLITKQK